ncbi:MAG: PIN domain-containing protein [Selenomonadaceae bacterium]|nr:PIN domain-containing protein [Selenomonadaceae bacterium]
MRIYLDNCCYNRHHDKKISDEIVADRNAVIIIQKEIIRKKIELATSFMLHYENYQNKNVRNRNYNDFFIKNYKTVYVGVEKLDELAKIIPKILECGVKIKDAYHIASAILAGCDFFVTVDKKLLKVSLEEIRIINLVELAKILEG